MIPYYLILKAARKGYLRVFGQPCILAYDVLEEFDKVSDLLYNELTTGKPIMIARYGANELNCITNYLEIKYGKHNALNYIKGESQNWWWSKGIMRCMETNAGFFPPTEDNLSKFSELMLEDSAQVDILGVFRSVYRGVYQMSEYMPSTVEYVDLNALNSFTADSPWTRYLKGKNVLVVHPFARLIEKQYEKRESLFANQEVLPSFNLITIEAVQSICGNNDQGFNDWFDALDWMKSEMDKVDYDIALIGCGAYGFPLAAHAKRTGHQAVHIGGSLQLLFGIKGKRWEDPAFLTTNGTYQDLMNNPAWVRPTEYLTEHSKKVENACYW